MELLTKTELKWIVSALENSSSEYCSAASKTEDKVTAALFDHFGEQFHILSKKMKRITESNAKRIKIN